jgi:ParB-like chromosome segregation protein Spo0J
MIPESYGIERVDVSALTAFSGNPRTHSETQVDQIAASIREFGWTNPILADADGMIIAGHGRLAAACKLGLQQVPVIRLGHLSNAQRKALVIADNQLALNAGWDVTVNKPASRTAATFGQYAVIRLRKVALNTWTLFGDLA